MKFRLLDVVVLERDIPQHRIRRGAVGAIVEVYEPDEIEVEFVDASGKTLAVLTLSIDDVRPAGDDDLTRHRKRAGSTRPSGHGSSTTF